MQFVLSSECSFGVLRGSLVKCLTLNPGVMGSSRTGSPRIFVEMSSGNILHNPKLVLVKPSKDMNNVKCRPDITEILMEAA